MSVNIVNYSNWHQCKCFLGDLEPLINAVSIQILYDYVLKVQFSLQMPIAVVDKVDPRTYKSCENHQCVFPLMVSEANFDVEMFSRGLGTTDAVSIQILYD